jgi:pimeloyl-ACP methyl ester carboxylesterase
MTAVFVHGNPETTAIWQPLINALGREDLIALSPPGFGAPVSDGFGASAEDYVGWLIQELAAIGRPVDVVGHDLGGGLVLGVATERPDLLRSWSSDTAGCYAPDYVWHPAAQVWQTEGAGEQAVASVLDAPTASRTQLYETLGIPHEASLALAEAYDETMARCILSLYRSVAQPAMARWGERLPDARTRPGLVIIPTEDDYTGGEARARWSAERAGAQIAVLHGLGHWWMLEDPERGAEMLRRFWNCLQ